LFAQNHLPEPEGDALRDLNQYYFCETNEQAAAKLPIVQKMTHLYRTAGAKEKEE
jgi:hypothetical protein